MTTKNILFIALASLFLSFSSTINAQKYEVEELKEEFEEWAPLRWWVYENDGTILLNPNRDGLDPISLLELVFQIENDFGFDGMWDEIETLTYFKILIEKQLDIKCSKCETFEELDEFVHTEKKAFTSQLSWNDPNNLRKGIKFTKKSDKLEKALITYKRAENYKHKEFQIKQKRLFSKWLIDNHKRIRVINWSQLVNDQFYRDKENERENISKRTLDDYVSKSLSFFNQAYDEDHLAKTRNTLAKQYGIFKGPSLDSKSEIVDEVFKELLESTITYEYERISCEETVESIVFSPEGILRTIFDTSERKFHFLRSYRDVIMSGARHLRDKNLIINEARDKTKKIKFMQGAEYERMFPSIRVNGHSKYAWVFLDISNNYSVFNDNGTPNYVLNYTIDKGFSKKEFIESEDIKDKNLRPNMRGVECNSSTNSYNGTHLPINFERHESSGATGFKYFYENKSLSRLEYYWALGLDNSVKIKDLPKTIFENHKPAIIADFKDNMLNGKVIVNMGIGNLIHPLISSVIVPDLKINGEQVFRYIVADSPFKITQCILSFSSNLLHGPANFHYIDKRTNKTGVVTVQFYHGISELDIKKLEK